MADVTPTMITARRDTDVRFRNGQFTNDVQIDGDLIIEGALSPTGGSLTPIATASVDGAITIKTSIVQITKATAAALTLAAPTAAQEGTIITFDSTTAAAHTLTVEGGLRGAGASANVGTWGGAIGDGVSLYAKNLFWWPVPGSNLNVTFA